MLIKRERKLFLLPPRSKLVNRPGVVREGTTFRKRAVFYTSFKAIDIFFFTQASVVISTEQRAAGRWECGKRRSKPMHGGEKASGKTASIESIDRLAVGRPECRSVGKKRIASWIDDHDDNTKPRFIEQHSNIFLGRCEIPGSPDHRASANTKLHGLVSACRDKTWKPWCCFKTALKRYEPHFPSLPACTACKMTCVASPTPYLKSEVKFLQKYEQKQNAITWSRR
jgi:hypothetical protein